MLSQRSMLGAVSLLLRAGGLVLLRFKFANYRSFKDEAELSAIATRLDREAAREELVSQETGETLNALPVAAILGGNASGKSNLIKAATFMREFVINSAFGVRPVGGTSRDWFRLDKLSQAQPTLFEVDFTHRGNRYVYGFELNDEFVTAEWLHTFPHRRTQVLFDREGSEFTFGRNLPGANKRIADLTRPNALYLSTAASSNHEALLNVIGWFYSQLMLVNLTVQAEAPVLAKRVEGQEKRISQMLRLADLGIVDARVERRPTDKNRRQVLRQDLEKSIPRDHPNREEEIDLIVQFSTTDDMQLRLIHRTAQGESPLPFDDESLGTKTWLVMVVNVLAALENGSTVIVDELDASLHPALMAEILRLFSDRKANRRGAQLIFTTHDTWSLDSQGETRLSRGQVWFVEKDLTGASTLTPLSEYRPRKGEDIQRGYLQGRYGGVPRPQSERLIEVASGTPRHG